MNSKTPKSFMAIVSVLLLPLSCGLLTPSPTSAPESVRIVETGSRMLTKDDVRQFDNCGGSGEITGTAEVSSDEHFEVSGEIQGGIPYLQARLSEKYGQRTNHTERTEIKIAPGSHVESTITWVWEERTGNFSSVNPSATYTLLIPTGVQKVVNKNLGCGNELLPIAATNHLEFLSVSTQRLYLVKNGLKDGERVYTDRDYVYDQIPTFLSGAEFMLTAADDKCLTKPSDYSLIFTVDAPATIYVTHDDRYLPASKPSWLSDFSDTGEDIRLTDHQSVSVTQSVFQKHVMPGTIRLGSNIDGTCDDLGNNGMFTLVVVPDK